MRDRFKQKIKKRDIYEKRVKALLDTQSSETGSNEGDSPEGMTQREAWIEFLSAYGDTYTHMAIIIRVMLVQLTNAADAERYFSWHKNLLGNLRQSIDVDSTLQALSVIKYNTDTEELQNDIVPETIKLFEKSYSRTYKCSTFRLES